MSSKPKYYITTPIYYASGNLHIGHTYTTVVCDAIARFKRMQGFDVFYLTGMDEHGQKVADKASESGKTPQEYVDGLADVIKKLWELMDISYDGFIRTTDAGHIECVQAIFEKLVSQGDIYKSKYVGKYCKPCESFWTPSQLVNGNCPDCGRPTEDAEEESYFFRLSKYSDRLRELLTSGDFLAPSTRVNEMVNNFIDKGLQDLAVSRTSCSWGVPTISDPKHVVYVWIDALINYISALGYGSSDESNFTKFWPADVHVVGKEIVRFHSIIWPAVLMALDIPLPKKVFGHGWIKINGGKMGKSVGNVVDPYVLAGRYGVDAIRYYLLSEMPFGADGDYTSELLLKKINSDLVNDMGNLVKRTVAMSVQYFGGNVTSGGEAGEFDDELITQINGLYGLVCGEMDKLFVDKALGHIFALISRANKYIDQTMPWILAKDESKKDRLNRVLYNLLESIRVSITILLPYFNVGPKKAFESLGLAVPTDLDGAKYGVVDAYAVENKDALYPRLDVAKELVELEKLSPKKEEPKPAPKQSEKAEEENEQPINIDDFYKCKLVVAEVLKCEKVPKADKLLKSTLQVGDEVREVVSGIAEHYTPEEMVGKKVVLIKNLAPRKIRGVVSHGMLLCAEDNGKLVLVSPESDVASGSEIG